LIHFGLDPIKFKKLAPIVASIKEKPRYHYDTGLFSGERGTIQILIFIAFTGLKTPLKI
tara:strand:- start:10338 stop:10514 length:177 start_codon:yes stop_codon:yes gene_type:complete